MKPLGTTLLLALSAVAMALPAVRSGPASADPASYSSPLYQERARSALHELTYGRKEYHARTAGADSSAEPTISGRVSMLVAVLSAHVFSADALAVFALAAPVS